MNPEFLLWNRTGKYDKKDVVYRNNWFEICNRNGYFSLEYGVPQVVVLPIIERSKILFVRVKRPLICDSPLELPAGGANKGESLVEVAARELKEETGIQVTNLERFEKMPLISELPGRSPELLTNFRINLSMMEYSSRVRHDTEIEKLELLDIYAVLKAVRGGEIYVSAVLAIVLRYIIQDWMIGNEE